HRRPSVGGLGHDVHLGRLPREGLAGMEEARRCGRVRELAGGRRFLSHAIVVLCLIAVLLALIPLALVLFYVIQQGVRSLNWAFFTHMPAPVGESGGGMANAIVGSLMITGLAALMAIPTGVTAGIY